VVTPRGIHGYRAAGRDTSSVAESEIKPEVPKAVAESTLSQLGARILNQLAISAWLPSAALTLLLALVVQVGIALHATTGHALSVKPLVTAFTALGEISIGALVLLFSAVVVLTMLTQAFCFEAIQLFEGYWGTNPAAKWWARRRCRRWRNLVYELEAQHLALTRKAWKKARRKIIEIQRDLVANGNDPELSDDMIDCLAASIFGDAPPHDLTQQNDVANYDWLQYARADTARDMSAVRTRLDDFPRPKRTLPTRLGNVIRHYEDETGDHSVQGMVGRVFDTLPSSLQVSHDEQRGRLDMYCSMTLVLLFAGLIAAGRFVFDDWRYAVSALTVFIVGAWFSYRAAIASARYYGLLLVTIAETTRNRANSTET
jgi:hypothetical protein